MRSPKPHSLTIDILFDLLGSLLLAVGLHSFAEPCAIAPGGVSGVALMLRHLFGLPVGLTTLLLNIPLLWLALRFLGKSFTGKTLRTLLISTVFIDSLAILRIPSYTGDRMMGSICAGLLIGAGLAFIFLRGSTTGGVDILSYQLQQRWPHIPIGRALLIIDGIILGASVLVFHDLESGLFGMAALFCQTKVIDGILYGIDNGSMVYIISNQHDQIAARILQELNRGATLLSGYGAYSRQPRNVLLCAVRRPQFSKLKSIVHETDPNAFLVVTEAGEIWGEGFKRLPPPQSKKI